MGWTLFLFLLLSICAGWVVMSRLSFFLSRPLLVFVAIPIFGIMINCWLVYLFTVLARSGVDRLGWGIVMAQITLSPLVAYLLRTRVKLLHQVTLKKFEIVLFVCCGVVSYWLMTKTLGGNGQTVWVGSHQLYDMGQNLGITRSFSLGNNIPFTSPFVAGTEFSYHFMFYFAAGVLEYLGLSLPQAINTLSILGFTTLLLMVFTLSQVLYGVSRLRGILAIGVFLAAPTLTWWYTLRDLGLSSHPLQYLWRNQNYYYAHPYDGTNISIFWSLNTWLNQRHFVWGAAVAAIVWIFIIKLFRAYSRRQVVTLGILCGALVLWHSTAGIAAFLVSVILFVLHARYGGVLYFIAGFLLFALPTFVWMWTASGGSLSNVESSQLHIWFPDMSGVTFLKYWWDNMGILPFVVLLGLMIGKKVRVILPFFVLFLFVLIPGSRIEISHTFINLLFIVTSVIAAYVVDRLLDKGIMGRVGGCILFVILTLSGVLEFPIIKNTFHYPVISDKDIQLMFWISNSTPKDAVFLSESNVLDMAVLSGRKNYFGYFRQSVASDRKMIIQEFLDRGMLPEQVDYLLVSNQVNPMYQLIGSHVVYEDSYYKVWRNRRID